MNRPAGPRRGAGQPRRGGGRPARGGYARSKGANIWAIIIPIGVLLLVGLGFMAFMSGDASRTQAAQAARGATQSITIQPGSVYMKEITFLKTESYTLTVKAGPTACRAAVVRLGVAKDSMTTTQKLARLNTNPTYIEPGQTGVIQSQGVAGWYIWGVWHLGNDPAQVSVSFSDTRGR